jgi:hypothetical protein
MDEHFKLIVWALLTVACLLAANSYFGYESLLLFLVMLSAFTLSMIFIFHGNFLSFGMVAQVAFSVFFMVFAGLLLYYFFSGAPSISFS